MPSVEPDEEEVGYGEEEEAIAESLDAMDRRLARLMCDA